jgi:hypothetical protein
MPKPPVEQFQAPRGVCRYCGCTYENACIFPDALPTPQRCYWTDPRNTICSAPACREQYRALQVDTLRALVSHRCLCGGLKSRRQMLCPICWRLLPWEMSALLYEGLPRGLSVYYVEAVAWLKAMRESR